MECRLEECQALTCPRGWAKVREAGRCCERCQGAGQGHGAGGRGRGARPNARDGHLTLATSRPLSPRPVVRAPGPAGGLRGALGRGCLHQLLLRVRHRALPEPALPAALLWARECQGLGRWDGWACGTAHLNWSTGGSRTPGSPGLCSV